MTRERELYNLWRDKLRDNVCFAEELAAIEGDDAEILDRFYCDLSFGTAGLRGVLGLGSNRMNIFTVRRATQGLAQYLLASCRNPSAAIAYDSRVNSDVFAKEAACVLAANGVKVHLYQELMPTPALSYAVRELGCDTGVVITASHNPAKYNGYKAYGSDGCQIGPEIADVVLENIRKLDFFDLPCMDFQEGLDQGMIRYIPAAFVEQYIDRVCQEALDREAPKNAGLNLVYTPLNGAGRRCVTTMLQKIGVSSVSVVPEQEMPDGSFPTCPYPNPEIRETMELGLRLSREKGADLLLATDPDADRVAVAVRDSGDYRILTGNEVGVLLLDYIASTRKRLGTLPEKPIAVKSIVSSKLTGRVAERYGVELVDVLTGFKFIGEVIAGLEAKGEADRFIFGFEESCGYLTGGYVRDKDAINASLLLVEMASSYKLAGKSIPEVLDGIYQTYGIYKNAVSSFAFEGSDGMKRMADIMQALRTASTAEIAGDKVLYFTDYKAGKSYADGRVSEVSLPPSDVLEYGLENGSTVIIRPSGTEPKIKIYYSLVGKTPGDVATLETAYSKACEAMIHV